MQRSFGHRMRIDLYLNVVTRMPNKQQKMQKVAMQQQRQSFCAR